MLAILESKWEWIAGTILALWSIYLGYKYRYPGSISGYFVQAVSLYNTVTKHFVGSPSIINNTPITPSSVLITGFLINDGFKDLTAEMVSKPVTLQLPSNHKWISVQITNQSDGVNATCAIRTPEELTFEFPLLRRREYIYYSSIIEIPVPPKDNPKAIRSIFSKIKASHRIVDTRSVRCRPLRVPRSSDYIGFGMLLVMFALTVGVLSFAYFGAGDKTFRLQVDYNILQQDGQILPVRIVGGSDGRLTIRALDGSSSRIMTPEEILERIVWKLGISVDLLDRKLTLGAFGLIVTFFGLTFVTTISGYIRSWLLPKELRRIAAS